MIHRNYFSLNFTLYDNEIPVIKAYPDFQTLGDDWFSTIDSFDDSFFIGKLIFCFAYNFPQKLKKLKLENVVLLDVYASLIDILYQLISKKIITIPLSVIPGSMEYNALRLQEEIFSEKIDLNTFDYFEHQPIGLKWGFRETGETLFLGFVPCEQCFIFSRLLSGVVNYLIPYDTFIQAFIILGNGFIKYIKSINKNILNSNEISSFSFNIQNIEKIRFIP